jgi:hypothetical protein
MVVILMLCNWDIQGMVDKGLEMVNATCGGSRPRTTLG